MKQVTLTTLLLLTVPMAAHAGAIGFAAGESCSVAADVVTCTAGNGRGSLVIEASVAAFALLRDALTPGYDGTMTCTDVMVQEAVTGCAVVGDVITISRQNAALINLYTMLRGPIVRDAVRAAEAAGAAGVNRFPDFGGGEP